MNRHDVYQPAATPPAEAGDWLPVSRKMEQQIRAAEAHLQEMSRVMLEMGWSSFDRWAQDMVGLESLMREWLCRIRQSGDGRLRERVTPTLMAFRSRLRLFSGLFTNYLLFLRGVAPLVEKRGQGYGVTGAVAVPDRRAGTINFREGA